MLDEKHVVVYKRGHEPAGFGEGAPVMGVAVAVNAPEKARAPKRPREGSDLVSLGEKRRDRRTAEEIQRDMANERDGGDMDVG